ncbi:outer membrane lipoprotein carrier protein LolA [Thermodesulfobacteriota bacterium]
MTAIRIIVLAITMLILGTSAFCNDPSPEEILNKVVATYKSMKTYKAEGTRYPDYLEKENIKQGIPFSILMKKPNLYLISWTLPYKRPDMDKSFVVWSDGTQPYLAGWGAYSCFKMPSDEIAFDGAAQNHGPLRMPFIIMSIFKGYDDPFYWLGDPKLEKIEKIGGEDCYVISGTSAISKRVAIWVSKTSYLIRKYYYAPDRLKMIKEDPRIKDKERKSEIEKYKRGLLPELKIEVEVYKEISSPELNQSDFKYILPEGTTCHDWPKNTGKRLDYILFMEQRK